MRRLTRTISVLGISAIILVPCSLDLSPAPSPSRSTTSSPESALLPAATTLFSITPEGTSEVAELSTAFAKMRSELLASQQRQIETEE